MRSLGYWQEKLARAEFRKRIVLVRLSRATSVRPPMRRKSWGGPRVMTHAGWHNRYVVWRARRTQERELRRVAGYLEARIRYYRERIEALSPLWVRLQQGVEL